MLVSPTGSLMRGALGDRSRSGSDSACDYQGRRCRFKRCRKLFVQNNMAVRLDFKIQGVCRNVKGQVALECWNKGAHRYRERRNAQGTRTLQQHIRRGREKVGRAWPNQHVDLCLGQLKLCVVSVRRRTQLHSGCENECLLLEDGLERFVQVPVGSADKVSRVERGKLQGDVCL